MTVAGAIQELREAPWPLLLEVLGLRAYARNKQTWDGAADPYALKLTPGLQQVKAVREAITHQRLLEQGRQ